MSSGLLNIRRSKRQPTLMWVGCNGSVSVNMGVFTLTQKYRNCYDTPINTAFYFPMREDISVVEFYATYENMIINSSVIPIDEADAIQSELAKNGVLPQCDGKIIQVNIGNIKPDVVVTISIKYIISAPTQNGYKRLSIPLVIPSAESQTLIDQQTYSLGVKFEYFSKTSIISATSPTHHLIVEKNGAYAKIAVQKPISICQDIIVDIQEMVNRECVLLKNDHYYQWQLEASYEEIAPEKRDYLFVADISSFGDNIELQPIREGYKVLIRNLNQNDMFNVFCGGRRLFSSEQHFNQENLMLADKFIDELDFNKTALGSVINYCLETDKERVVMLISNGDIIAEDTVIKLVSLHQNITFYTLSFVNNSNCNFMEKLSEVSGGESFVVAKNEKIANVLILEYSRIMVSILQNVHITWNSENIYPNFMPLLHNGEKFSVLAKSAENICEDENLILLEGELLGKAYSHYVKAEKIITAGEELNYLYGKKLLDLIWSQPHCKCDVMKNIAVENNLVSPFTKFAIHYEKNGSSQVLTIPLEIPNMWDYPAKVAHASVSKIQDDFFIEVAASQQADGSFLTDNMEAFDSTIHAVEEFCTLCENYEIYSNQIRKAVIYLLNMQENSQTAYIPDDLVQALKLWFKKIGGYADEVVQKVEALVFLYSDR